MKTRMIHRIFTFVFCMTLGLIPTIGQTDTIIALQSDVTAVETGQYYTVSLSLQDVSDVWQINAEIEYDPTLVYVVGTVSGSPLTIGDFYSGEPNLVVRNGVAEGQIVFTHSLVSPANPKSGSGLLATFQIYPLSAGNTQLRFSSANLTQVEFVEDANGDRDIASTEDLPVLPALLDLTITGETVPVPDESTPTPEPTPTSNLDGQSEQSTAEPTLVNITLAPDEATPEPFPTLIPEIDEDDNIGIGSILPIAIGLLIVGGIGALILFGVSRRK